VLLLVEDNEDDLELMQVAFRRSGAAAPIVIARDGEEAVRVLGEQRFRLVLLDLKLPRLSGFDVLRHIRSSGTHRHVPVVVLTSSPDPSDIARGYALGANSYLVKPVGLQELTEMVGTVQRYWLDFNRTADGGLT
jgi:two-component system response regulator